MRRRKRNLNDAHDWYVPAWSDYPEAIREAVALFKDAGLRARHDESVYVGLRLLEVHRRDMRRALGVLRAAGMADSGPAYGIRYTLRDLRGEGR